MIDNFNEIYTRITSALQEYDSKVKTSSVYTNSPSSYPFVSVELIEDYVYERGSDSGDIENFANNAYEINVYSKGNTAMSKARELSMVVDNFMKSVGFTRVSKTPMQDQNETLYRIILRYEGVVSKDLTVYRR